jgi:SAM-dependent methyltransferase
MPTSHYLFIEDMLKDLHLIMPKKILDVGIGFGKFGFLFREMTDIYMGNVFKKDWKTRIDGIEIFEPYIEKHQRHIYSNIYIGDASKVIDSLDNDYDLIFCGDVIEHLPKKEGIDFIKKLNEKCKHLYISIPVGEYWIQNSLYGNDHEKHLSVWDNKDFYEIDGLDKVHTKQIDHLAKQTVSLVHFYNGSNNG